MQLANVTVFCFLASYTVAFVLECTRLAGRTKVGRVVALLFAAAGLVAHTAYLLQRSSEANLPPLLSSMHDWLLVLAWLAIVFYLFLSLVDRDLGVGLFLLPPVLLLIGAAYFVSDRPNPLVPSDAARDAFRNWVMLHASLLVIGIAGIVLGFVLSLMYLAQHHRLKHKHAMSKGLTLPSLERLARLNWWAVVVSVPLLSLGMATGVGMAVVPVANHQPLPLTDPVIIIDGVAWLLMVAFFSWMLITRRPAGKQVAWMTFWAFGFLLVALIGLQVLAVRTGFASKTWHGALSAPGPVTGIAMREGDTR